MERPVWEELDIVESVGEQCRKNNDKNTGTGRTHPNNRERQ